MAAVSVRATGDRGRQTASLGVAQELHFVISPASFRANCEPHFTRCLAFRHRFVNRFTVRMGDQPQRGSWRRLGDKVAPREWRRNLHQSIAAALLRGFDHRPLESGECCADRLSHPAAGFQRRQSGNSQFGRLFDEPLLAISAWATEHRAFHPARPIPGRSHRGSSNGQTNSRPLDPARLGLQTRHRYRRTAPPPSPASPAVRGSNRCALGPIEPHSSQGKPQIRKRIGQGKNLSPNVAKTQQAPDPLVTSHQPPVTGLPAVLPPSSSPPIVPIMEKLRRCFTSTVAVEIHGWTLPLQIRRIAPIGLQGVPL